MKALIGFSALAFFAATSVAAENEPVEKTSEEKKICKTDRATGSLTRRTRICMTRAEWDELSRRQAKDYADLERNQSRVVGTLANNPGAGGN